MGSQRRMFCRFVVVCASLVMVSASDYPPIPEGIKAPDAEFLRITNGRGLGSQVQVRINKKKGRCYREDPLDDTLDHHLDPGQCDCGKHHRWVTARVTKITHDTGDQFLPPGWIMYKSQFEYDKTYYYNEKTNQTKPC